MVCIHYCQPSRTCNSSSSISSIFHRKTVELNGDNTSIVLPVHDRNRFFLPLDLSFSCWFFFLFRQLSRVFSSYIGIHHLPGCPHFHEQSAGAWICLAFIAFWLTRNHLTSSLKFAWSGKNNMDMDEPMSLFSAFFFLDLGLT